MAVARQIPDFIHRPGYNAWLEHVRADLGSMHTDLEAWRKQWKFDFRREYEAGVPPHEAALRAHDFWWQRLLSESWT